jgi:cytochrome-b5 reductase
MSSHVHSLNVGETIDIKGPFEKYNSGKKPLQQVSIVAGTRLRSKSLFA